MKHETQIKRPPEPRYVFEAVRKAKTREELYGIIKPYTDLPEPSLSLDSTREWELQWEKFRYLTQEAASRIYRENPKLPEPPTGTNIPIATVANWCVKPQAKSDVLDNCEHSPDYRSITWYGQSYTFNPTQAKAIKLLWAAWENPDKVGVHQKDVAAAMNSASENYRLVYSFRKNKKYHPAWRTIIKHNGDGVYSLVEPQKELA